MLHDRTPSEIATGRWPWILAHFGVQESFLKNRHSPCPICGGKDRYRFDDRDGRGTWICNQCGSGDGYALLQKFKGWSFRDALHEVSAIAGSVQASAFKSTTEEAKKMASVKRIWGESMPIAKGDPAWLYLNRRIGLDISPSSLRFHPALPYVEGESIDYHPALVAAVTDHSGIGVGVHRIYLTSDGEKAQVDKPKKLMAGKAISGASVRLGKASECLGIAEGIETALAASRKFGTTTWAAISAGLMEQWNPPESVKHVVIFGDNDASFTGQASAYALAKRLSKTLDVEVRIPGDVGKDWAD